MFFKKNQEPKKQEPVNPKQILKEKYIIKCRDNTNNILTKLEEKYNDSLHLVKEDRVDEFQERFKRISLYMEGVNWEGKIEQVLDTTQDEPVATFCLQLEWNIIREDVNRMILDITKIIEVKL